MTTLADLIRELRSDIETLYAVAHRWEGRGWPLADSVESLMQTEAVAGPHNTTAGHVRDDLHRHLDGLAGQCTAAHRSAVGAAVLLDQVRTLVVAARQREEFTEARRRVLLRRIGRGDRA